MTTRRLPMVPPTQFSRHALLMSEPRVYVVPDSAHPSFAEAVLQGGGKVVASATDAKGLVWTDGADPEGLRTLLKHHPHIRWVQLPWSGVEEFAEAGLFDLDRVWTSAKGVCALPVAEHALALALAGLHCLHNGYTITHSRSLAGSQVTIFGGGAVARQLVKLLVPLGCHITLVRRHAGHIPGADRVLGFADRYQAFPGADIVCLALALTSETKGLIGAHELNQMEKNTWLINVARGQHVITDDLVEALCNGCIGGAALDVTDPEPLPDDHPLRSLPNCLLTPHVATTEVQTRALLMYRISENIRRFAKGTKLLGCIDPILGY